MKSIMLFVCLASMLAGCAMFSRNGQVAAVNAELQEMSDRSAVSGGVQENTPGANATNKEYLIGAGDLIKVFAVDIPELTDEYTIGPDGKITLPYIGIINLRNMTRTDASRAIEEKLTGVYHNPEIHVIVEEYNNNRVFVLGEVRMPGEYNFAGPPTLLGALARAQGLTKQADLRACTIVRGRGTLMEVNLYDLLRRGNRRLNIALQPEDTVYVKSDEDNTFYVLGEVRHPGAYARTQDVDIVEAIAQAGGMTENGRSKDIRLIKRGSGLDKPAATQYDLKQLLSAATSKPPRVHKADIVYVPRRHLASFNYVLRQITPSLNLFLLGDAVFGTMDEDD